MALEPTGYLDFNWSSTPDVDGYKIKLYKNNSYFKTDLSSENNIRVSGLLENDSVRGLVYSYKGDSTSSSFINLDTQTVPVRAFEETFTLANLNVNGTRISLSELNGYFSGEYNYTNPTDSIQLSIVSPRSQEVLLAFNEEPFLDSISYNIYSLDHLQLIESKEVNSLSFDIVNTGQYGRNYVGQVQVDDFYGSGLTGNLSFLNEPISVKSLSTSYTGSEELANLSLLTSYSTECLSVDYVVYDNNDLTGNYLLSGNTESVYNYNIDLSSNFSGAIKITPHDWYGSGYNYVKQNIHFPLLESTTKLNKIKNNYLNPTNYSTNQIFASYDNDSNSGSYFELSIDQDNTNSFDLDSYFTGRFDNLSGDYEFDFFSFSDPLDKSIQTFYINLNLYQSGSNILEDTALMSGSLTPPHFILSGVDFNYENGLTDIFFNLVPQQNYSGIDLMISGKSDSDYYIYSGLNYEVEDLYPQLELKITNSIDPTIIYDQIEISASGLLPSISAVDYNQLSSDGFKTFTILNDNINVPVNQIRSYGRFAFSDTSTGLDTLGQSYTDILEFNDFLNFEQAEVKYLGTNLSVAPSGLTRNINYTIPNSTASFASGLHYIHRFVPENGYGTGHVTEVFPIEYPLNPFTEYIDGNQKSTDKSISNIQDDFATEIYVRTYVDVKTTATSNQLNDGSSVVNLDTSNYKNFIIDNQNNSNLSINFQNVSDIFFNTSIFIFNSTNLTNLSILVDGSPPSSSRNVGSYSSSYHSLEINLASLSNNWYIINRIT
jgi:hypothetical protein